MLKSRFSKIVTLMVFFIGVNFAHAQATSVVASVDKNPAMADESIVLTVVANGEVDRNDFDPSILSDDFVVGRTSFSSQTRMVNFNTTRSTTWTTILIPRKQGTFTIPSFKVSGQQTQPIVVRIIPPAAATSGQLRDVFVTAEVDNTEVYLQQQIKYSVKIHLSADLQRGSLAAPVLENAEIRPLGEDKEYSEIVDGNRYRIIERVFAIIPQASGKVTIKGPLFEGDIVDNRRQSFAYFNQTKPINRVAPDIELNVLPIDTNYSGHWLPSEMVQINDQWQPKDNQFIVGEPVTRTITLTALGLVEEQLPTIEGNYPPDFKTYPDQASTTTVVKDENLIAQRVENIAVIPSRPGQFVLPEIVVPWFNVVTKQTEYARLPARSVEVIAAANGSTTSNVPPVATSQPSNTIIESPVSIQSDSNLANTPASVVVNSWWSVSSWILLGLWLTTMVLWWWTSKHKTPLSTPSDKEHNESALWKALNTALESQQANLIYAAMQKWFVAAGLPLAEYQSRFESQGLNMQIEQMFSLHYTGKQSEWKSDALLAQLKDIRKELRAKVHNERSLKPLYS